MYIVLLKKLEHLWAKTPERGFKAQIQGISHGTHRVPMDFRTKSKFNDFFFTLSLNFPG